MRIKEFLSGGGGGGGGEGGSRPKGKKTALTAFSVCLFCVALKLLTEVFQRGSFIFQGSIFFPGGGGGGGVRI